MKETIKYLAGGAVVYGVVAACGNVTPDFREPNAHAAPTEVACGRCAGSVQSISADSDPKQWVGGVATTDEQTRVIELGVGPFYVTDMRAVDGQNQLVLVDAKQACDDTVPGAKQLWRVSATTIGEQYVNQGPVHGTRFLIKAGQKLCLTNLPYGDPVPISPATVVWAGFRPYS